MHKNRIKCIKLGGKTKKYEKIFVYNCIYLLIFIIIVIKLTNNKGIRRV